MSHPIDVPTFDWQNSKPVWYLAHPVAGDDRFSYEQNMVHVLQMLKLCWDEGYRCIAPWYELCLIFDETNMANRIAGLEADCKTVRALGRIILTGHKISRGMRTELDGLFGDGQSHPVIDLSGMNDRLARHHLKEMRDRNV